MKEMNIEYLNLNEIKPYENNPRHNEEAVKYVANSIKEFGFKVPIIIDQNNIIVAGHTRLKAAEKLNIEKVPCIRASDLSEKQIKAFRLADNKVAEMSTWDLDKLNVELENIDFNMNEFGFTEFNMDEPNFDELERNDMNENNNEKRFVIKITFDTYNDWLEKEDEVRKLVENSNATMFVGSV